MFMQLAHILGIRRKDEAVEKRFAKMKARYGTTRQDVDLVSHVRGDLDSPWVVGGEPQTMGEVRQMFLEKYAKGVSGEVQAELIGSAR